MVELLNAYLDAVRRLHDDAMLLPKFARTGGATAGAPNVCLIPAPPAPSVPIPYPNVPASSATKTPATKLAQRSKIEWTHHQIKSSTDTPAAQMGGIVSNHIKGVCEFVLYSFDVKMEGKNVPRTLDLLSHNDRNT
jgi:hypothetical protein